jgi:hypothetical protein
MCHGLHRYLQARKDIQHERRSVQTEHMMQAGSFIGLLQMHRRYHLDLSQ